MNWIDMSDKEKLFSFAKEFKPSVSKILSSSDISDSYFTDCSNTRYEPDIMIYNVQHYGQLKNYFTDIWSESGLLQHDLLATIVSAIALKNMPPPMEHNVSLESKSEIIDKQIKKEAYESVNSSFEPPTFIYEF